MAITMDYSQIKDMNVADGTYEVVINGVKEDANKNTGTQFVNYDMIIRNDITNQKYQNAHVFHKVYVDKSTGKYNLSMLMTVAKYAGVPDHTAFNSIEDYINALWHKPVRVTVKNEKRDYQGKEYENLNIKRWHQTEYPELHHQFKKAESNNQQAAGNDPFGGNGQDNTQIDISDDDLPF